MNGLGKRVGSRGKALALRGKGILLLARTLRTCEL